MRDASGSFTIFDDPDAVQGVQLGTTARAINARGAIAGSYVDKNTGIVQAFIRDTQGNFTNFVPTSDTVSVYPTGINLSGEVTGYYFTDALGPEHAFVRDSAGNVTLIDKTVAKDTLTLGINDGGTIFGQWDLGFGYVEGFRRDASGKMTGISIPNNRGTRPLAINNKGRITGSYASQDSTYHGFVE